MSSRSRRGPDPSYWAEYSPHQRAKHELIRRYLGGWFAKLGSWAGRVLYVDTHAGRGRHESGEIGSPLVALKVLLEHRARDQLLARSEFQFHFIEHNERNFAQLQREIATLPALPDNVKVFPRLADSFSLLSGVVADLRTSKRAMAPAFVFVDPYGFSIPGRILRDLMSAGRVELFVNVMWREVDMAIAQSQEGGPLTDALDSLFGGGHWRGRVSAPNFEARIDQAVELLAESIGARWPTYIRMLGANRVSRYVLVHFSNHDGGRDLMKEAMWHVAPDGACVVRKTDDGRQLYLLSPEPDLTPLRRWVLETLERGAKHWGTLDEALRALPWRDTHLRSVLQDLHRAGEVVAAEGKFTRKSNPLLRRASASRSVPTE